MTLTGCGRRRDQPRRPPSSPLADSRPWRPRASGATAMRWMSAGPGTGDRAPRRTGTTDESTTCARETKGWSPARPTGSFAVTRSDGTPRRCSWRRCPSATCCPTWRSAPSTGWWSRRTRTTHGAGWSRAATRPDGSPRSCSRPGHGGAARDGRRRDPSASPGPRGVLHRQLGQLLRPCGAGGGLL